VEHGSTRISTATDYAIDTYEGAGVTYALSRAPFKDSVMFITHCSIKKTISLPDEARFWITDFDNHCLAYYIKTGDMPRDGVIVDLR